MEVKCTGVGGGGARGTKGSSLYCIFFCGWPGDSLFLRDGPGSWKPVWKVGAETLMEGD